MGTSSDSIRTVQVSLNAFEPLFAAHPMLRPSCWTTIKLLVLIAERGSVTPGRALAAELRVSRSTASRHVRILREKGFARRSDGTRIVLTPNGRRLVRQLEDMATGRA